MFKKKYLFCCICVFFLMHKISCAENITSIIVNGNKKIDKNNIIHNSTLLINTNIDDKTIDNAINNIYKTTFFSDIKITSNKKGEITINVVENPFINNIHFNNADKFPESEFKKTMSLQEKSSFTRQKMKNDLDQIYGFYQKSGYLNVKIEPKIIFLEHDRVDIIFNVTEGTPSSIEEIIFLGNKNFSKSTLTGLLSLTPSSLSLIEQNKYEEDKFEQDKKSLINFYLDSGYLDFKMLESNPAFNKKNNNVTITYFLDEGEKYKIENVFIISETPNITKNTLKNEIKNLKNGQNYRQSEVDKTKGEIEKYLSEKGIATVNMEIELKKNQEKHTVDIIFQIKKGKKLYINQIFFKGNIKTDVEILLREMYIHEGDLYNKYKIDVSKDRLYMTGFFKTVNIKEIPIENSDRMNLEITVEEQFFGNTNFSIGYSNLFGLIGQAQLQIHNIAGKGYTAGLNAMRSGFSESYSLSLYDPYMFHKYDLGLGMDIFYSGYGDIGGIGTSSIVTKIPYKGYSVGTNIFSSFRIIERLHYNFGIGYSYHENRVISSFLYQLYDQLIGTRQTYHFNHSITWNQLNKARYSTEGYMIQYMEKYGGLGIGLGNQDFIKRTLQGTVYIPLFYNNLIIKMHLEGGHVQKLQNSANIGIEHLFSLGYYKMRGFSFFGLGPRIERTVEGVGSSAMPYAIQSDKYFYGTIELRSPLFLPKEYNIYFTTFLDFGSVWGFPGTFTQTTYTMDGLTVHEKLVDDSLKLRMSAGIGLLWQGPMGEIGVYYAKPIMKQPYDIEMSFGIMMGQQF